MALTAADLATSAGGIGKSAISLHARLKARIAILHHQVEKTFDLKRRVVTLAGYHEAISMLRDIHCAVQRSLDQMADGGVVFDRGQTSARIAWVDEDLVILGVGARPSEVPKLVLQNADEALGCLYVVEGAGLGSQHIFWIVQRRFGFD